jgi:hypothetical protein
LNVHGIEDAEFDESGEAGEAVPPSGGRLGVTPSSASLAVTVPYFSDLLG